MSGINTPHTPPAPSIREAAAALLAALDHEADAMVEDVVAYDAACRASTKARIDLAEALAQPERSRPGVLPDVPLAMASIAAIKAGEPIEPAGIRAIVALAELGYEELASFDLRWAADRRAVARWREANPGNDLVCPDHADLVVWLLEALDCSFDRPTIADVEMVLGRLKGAQLRMPNALTKDTIRLITDMAEAMRKLARKAFLVEHGKPSSIGEVTLDLKADVGDALGMLAVWTDGVALLVEAAGYLQHEYPEIHAKIEAFLERAPLDPDAATGCADDSSTLGNAVAAIVGGKNTADYDRRQLEARINAKLIELGPDAEVDACVHDIAPGWVYSSNAEEGGAPFVTLIRYAPGEPL